MATAEQQLRRKRIQGFLSESPRDLAERLVTANPWLCRQMKVDFSELTEPLLRAQDLPRAKLYLVGSAATGFSLSAEKAGRSFKKTGGFEKPSDLDIGIVDEDLFESCWNEMVEWERQSYHYLEDTNRVHVYWGRIDRHRLPERAATKVRLQNLLNAVEQSPEFRGYPTSIRVYRRRDDLIGYLEHSIHVLSRRIER